MEREAPCNMCGDQTFDFHHIAVDNMMAPSSLKNEMVIFCNE